MVSRKRYTKEFKVDAVKMVVEQGQTQAETARNLGIAESMLGRWVRQSRASGPSAFPGSGKLAPMQEALRRLQRELKRVTMEREILKKAITFFAEPGT
jgi:transposase